MENNKKKKNIILSCIVCVVCILGIFGAFKWFGGNSETKQQEVNAVSSYEILDENVLTSETLKKWVGENSLTAGEYITSDKEYTYVLLANGKTTDSNVGICLEGVKADKGVNVSYSILKSKDSKTVEEYSPKMILRFKGTNLKVKVDKINK